MRHLHHTGSLMLVTVALVSGCGDEAGTATGSEQTAMSGAPVATGTGAADATTTSTTSTNTATGTGATSDASGAQAGSEATQTVSTDTTGSGGAVTSQDGATAMGGTIAIDASGGASSVAETGGASATAATADSGSGGASASGGSAAETASGGAAVAIPTSGCGATTWPESGASYTLDVDGIQREYIMTLPEGYDSSTPYRLIFAWHGRTGTADQIANGFGGRGGNGYYGLESLADGSAIFVAGQGLGTDADPADTGWPNTGGRDVAFVDALVEWLNANLCVDQARIFTTGMSYGGIMSNTLGCERPNVFRAIAPIAGALFGRGQSCTGERIAAWMTHGTADMDVDIGGAETARDLILEANSCDTSLEPVAVEPSPCVAYQGCDEGYPVHWCVHDGGHIIPDFSAQAIWSFFEQF